MTDNTISKTVLGKLTELGFACQRTNGIYNLINRAAEEGIVVDGNDVNSFAYINGERAFGEASTDVIFTAVEMIIRDVHGVPTESECAAVPATDADDASFQVIESDAIENHPGTIPVLLAMQRTPKQYVKYREGPRKTMLAYVDGNYMQRALNYAFLFDWSFDVPETRQDGEFFTALGVLTVNLNGKTVTKSQWGSQKIRKGMELGDALKGATTDAMKKCTSLFGIASDVYAGEHVYEHKPAGGRK